MSTAKTTSLSGAKETVLLRKPAPKYGFAGRKLPKEPVNTGLGHSSGSTPSTISSSPSERNKQVSLTNTGLVSGASPQQKPVAVVGASFHSHSSSVADFRAKKELTTGDHQSAQLLGSASSTPNLVDSVGGATTATLTSQVKNLNPFESSTLNNHGSIKPQWYIQGQNASNASITEENQAGDMINERGMASSSSLSEELQAVKEERDKLRKELNAQLQVNTELKRLLVASVGDDLYQRVENLCR